MIYLDNKKMIIKFYETIQMIEPSLLLFIMHGKSYKVEGNNLEVSYFSKEEIHIQGTVKSLKID